MKTHKKVLVPLDGSKLSEMALPHAVAMSRANNYTLMLLRVAPHPVYVNATSMAFAPTAGVFEGWEDEVNAEAEYLESTAKRLREEGIDTEVKLLEDEPASAIINYGREHPEIAMIVMSTHGRSGISRWIFGSVAEKVLHGATVPLLLVRPTEGDELPASLVPPVYKSLVVPLDGSELAAQAIDHACALAKDVNGTITLVLAVPEAPTYTEVISPPIVSTEWENQAEEMINYLEQSARTLREAGCQVKTRLEHGAPAEAILRAADQAHADMIVMATHGRSGLPRLWLGSVAMKVVQAAKRPVLLVRPTAVHSRAEGRARTEVEPATV